VARRLAVDDAGAGFASFRHILNLRPDVIKLDIGLTRGIDVDPARRALGTALLNFGFGRLPRHHGGRGIETQGESFNTLRAWAVGSAKASTSDAPAGWHSTQAG